jgi:pimeloyl-ACP methyl ester carboxylesterase
MESAAATAPSHHTFPAPDGARLAYRQLGAGRPLVLLHGYLMSGEVWLRTGIAQRLAADGRRLILPDLRGHGDSERPHDPQAYPADALTSDGLALIAHLDLTDYDLGGYSLGARIAARMMAVGARPGRAVLGGTGLDPIVHAAGRGDNYRRILGNLGTFEPGSPEAQIASDVASEGADPIALMRVLDTFVDTPADALAQVPVPTLVFAGDADTSRGSVEDLAALLPYGRLLRVPGDHFGALLAPELLGQLATFLASPPPGDRP